MISQCLTKNNKSVSFSFYAKLDWLLIVLMNTSPAFVLPFVFFSLAGAEWDTAFALGISYLFWNLVALYLTALIVDFICAINSCPTQPVDASEVLKLKYVLAGSVENGVLTLLETAECVPSDHSLGARITGVWKQKVVLSGGMLAALRRKDKNAICNMHSIARVCSRR